MINEIHRKRINELVNQLNGGEISKAEFDLEFTDLVQRIVTETEPEDQSEFLAQSKILNKEETFADLRTRNAATIARKL